ncbi:MAG: hypothetical protein ACRC35_00530 [Angustibacter sp.]
MLTLVLPSLVAGRDLADQFVDRLAGDLHDQVVTVDARRLTRGTPSFAAQLTQRLLDGGAQRMVLRGAPHTFGTQVRRAARELHAADRLVVEAPSQYSATA